MRLFVAIELSSEVRESIAAFQEELKPQVSWVRWVRPENLHLTLRFVGEADPSKVQALTELLSQPLVGFGPFAFELQGFGCFPTPKRARVIWVGVNPVPAELRRLQSVAESSVRQLGVEPEMRPFEPHLTIARLKRPDPALAGIISASSGRSFGRLTVSELVLFESRLSPRGASYRVLKKLGLGGTAREQLV